jgi:hypothetical protein
MMTMEATTTPAAWVRATVWVVSDGDHDGDYCFDHGTAAYAAALAAGDTAEIRYHDLAGQRCCRTCRQGS